VGKWKWKRHRLLDTDTDRQTPITLLSPLIGPSYTAEPTVVLFST
jgi:hypothetical protein